VLGGVFLGGGKTTFSFPLKISGAMIDGSSRQTLDSLAALYPCLFSSEGKGRVSPRNGTRSEKSR